MLDKLGNEDCVKQALEALEELTKESNLDDMGKRVIIKAIKDFVQEADIQVLGLKVLQNLIIFGKYTFVTLCIVK